MSIPPALSKARGRFRSPTPRAVLAMTAEPLYHAEPEITNGVRGKHIQACID